MWLFTVHGFYSVVESHDDPNVLYVRARTRAHLAQLKKAHPSLGKATIQESPERDYRWRLIVARSAWEATAAQLTMEIDYGNFKSAASSEHPDDTAYLDALHQVWATMESLSRSRPRTVETGWSTPPDLRSAPLPKVYQRRMEALYNREVAAREEPAKPQRKARKSKRRKPK